MAQTAPRVIVLRAGTWAATSARRSSSTLPFCAPRNTLPSQEEDRNIVRARHGLGKKEGMKSWVVA
jgi:hypothetical protein